MTEEKRTQLKVGSFALAGLILFALTIFFLGGTKTLLTSYYPLKVKLKDVQGLQGGSVVTLTGIPVGNVTAITFVEKNNALEVSMRIDKEYRNRIREGSSAKVKTQGALGDKFLYITPSSLDNPILKDNGLLTSVSSGDIFSLLEKSNKFEKIFDILNEMHILLARINSEQRSEKIMTNLVDSSDNLKQLLKKSENLLQDIKNKLPNDDSFNQSIKSLASVLDKVDSGKGTLGALINDASLHERLKTLFGGSPRNKHLKNLIRNTIKKSEE